MLRFFRRIRKSLFDQKRFSRYLLYALGEVVLVVIGILIALQLNNMNEERKQRELAVATFDGVQKEIEENLEKVILNLQFAHRRDRNLRYFLCGDPNEADLDKYWKDMVMVTSSSPGNFLNSEALDEVIKNAPNLPETYESSLLELKKLSSIQIKLKDIRQSLFEGSVKDTELIFKSNPWMNDQFRFDFDETHKATAIEYLKSSSEYKALMSQNLIGVSVFSRYLKEYRKAALAFLQALNEQNLSENYDERRFIIPEKRTIAGTYKVYEYSPDSTQIKWVKGVHIIEQDSVSGRLYSYTNRDEQKDSLYLESVKREIIHLGDNNYYFQFWDHFYAIMDSAGQNDTLAYRVMCTDNPYVKVRIQAN